MENPNYRAQIQQAYADMNKAPADPWRPAYHLTPPRRHAGRPQRSVPGGGHLPHL